MRPHAQRRQAFTLFEVAISTLILTIAVLSTLALLPSGMRAQKLARYQLFASAQAQTLMESFHSPLPLLRGHGYLAPNLDVNLARSAPGSPPVPGWAWRMRETNLQGSQYQPDIERALCGWMTGAAPVPLDIARRLDSDGDEIQDLLDQGGYLFYSDPGFVRDLSLATDRDKSAAIEPAPEAQKLVFAVTGYAQENACACHPLESWPWYEMYPFPPQWVGLRAYGREVRRGPIWTCISFDDAGNPIAGRPPIEGENMLGSKGTLWQVYQQGNAMTADGGLPFGDGGHAAYEPVFFDPAPFNRDYLTGTPVTNPAHAPMQPTSRPIDPEDVTPNFNEPYGSGTVGWYQGRNWRYFKETMPGSPWATGWDAFQRLAGFNDAHRDLAWTDYAALPASEHFEKQGWLPVMACLLNPFEAKYDAYWYEPEARNVDGRSVTNFKGVWAWRDQHGGGIGSAPGIAAAKDVGTGVFPPPVASVPGFAFHFQVDTQPWTRDKTYNLALLTQAPLSTACPPTYEMRANYRDRAIDLWNAVTMDLTTLADGTAVTKLAKAPGVAVANTQVDCDSYEYPPTQLDSWQVIDPSNLPSGNGSPHPAQVLALSYLAHAAMMVTGWSPNFTNSVGHLLDWDALVWEYLDPTSPGGSHAKDAKLVDQDALKGSSSVRIRNDTDAPIQLYAGDIICFEADYREWVQRARPNPRMAGSTTPVSEPGHLSGAARQAPWNAVSADYLTGDGDMHGFMGAAGDRRVAAPRTYRVQADLRIEGGGAGDVAITPPLVSDITKTTKRYTDQYAATTWPRLPLDLGHQQQLIRFASAHDLAFARKVHEMCMRWAARYGAENAYDWGAPRMMNHQLMTDKPLALFDLFYDAARGASSDGKAQRLPQNLPTADAVSPSESFYRWIMQPNPAPRSWFPDNSVSGAGPACCVSHLGPGRNSQADWLSVVRNTQVAPPSSAGTSGPWNYTSDAKRYWLNRHFSAFHRCRQLVFWAVDWKSYEDAETAPSAPLDVSRLARTIRLNADGKSPLMLFPMIQAANGYAQGTEWDLFARVDPMGDLARDQRYDSMLAGNPENALLWTDASRSARWIDSRTGTWGQKDYWTYVRGGSDLVIGHWGADRNNNRVLDIGPIPKTTRMHAMSVARFNVYDPVLRLNVND